MVRQKTDDEQLVKAVCQDTGSCRDAAQQIAVTDVRQKTVDARLVMLFPQHIGSCRKYATHDRQQ